MAPSQIEGTGAIQPSEDEQVPSLVDYKVLLVPPYSRFPHLVHLRLLGLLFRYLLFSLAEDSVACDGAVVEVLWLVRHLCLHSPLPHLIRGLWLTSSFLDAGTPSSTCSTFLERLLERSPATGLARDIVWQ